LETLWMSSTRTVLQEKICKICYVNFYDMCPKAASDCNSPWLQMSQLQVYFKNEFVILFL